MARHTAKSHKIRKVEILVIQISNEKAVFEDERVMDVEEKTDNL